MNLKLLRAGKFVSFPIVKLRLILPAFIVAVFLLGSDSGLAQMPLSIANAPTNRPIASWSFLNETTWASDHGYAPISFTNLGSSWLGDGASLVVDTNLPAWLNFNVIEPSTGATNLVLKTPGSLTFWYAPNWTTTNGGPGQWAQLIDVGEWTSNSTYGYWGLLIDSTGSNLWFLSQDGAGSSYGLSTPISWTTNYFHYVALTYSSTNVSIYLDGALATNDPGGLSIWPGSTAVSRGMYFGSDTNGLMQANGLFDSVEAYTYPLGSNDVQNIYYWDYGYYMMDPYNIEAMDDISPASSDPSSSPTTPDVITGQGNLTPVSTNASCITSSNVWLTNIVVAVAGTNMNITFAIAGGSNGIPYDVFANSVLALGTNYGTNVAWAWMGQGYQCVTYTLTNLPNTDCFLILGTPQDSDTNGLTDAYELLVTHTNPYVDDQNGAGIPNGWQVLLGLNPLVNQVAQPSTRSNYGYTAADWLSGVTGIRSGTISTDPEGNVQSVSQ